MKYSLDNILLEIHNKEDNMETIQMANTKIDEIRTAFTDWLHSQNDEFKNRLTDQYNNTFNCFVRPNYNGTHQEFPGLDRKSLGIEDLYSSQKDTVWIIKLNNGAICDHEAGSYFYYSYNQMDAGGYLFRPQIGA